MTQDSNNNKDKKHQEEKENPVIKKRKRILEMIKEVAPDSVINTAPTFGLG